MFIFGQLLRESLSKYDKNAQDQFLIPYIQPPLSQACFAEVVGESSDLLHCPPVNILDKAGKWIAMTGAGEQQRWVIIPRSLEWQDQFNVWS